LEYLDKQYYFYNLDEKYRKILKLKVKIVNIYLDISSKSLTNYNLLYSVKRNKYIYLQKFNFNKFINEVEIIPYTKILVNEGFADDSLNQAYKFSSFAQIDQNSFIICNKSFILYFERFGNISILRHKISIQFLNTPLYVNNLNEILLISSELFIYRIKVAFKENNAFNSIFQDLTLNFNNQKYLDLLETIKIITYYNIEIDKIELKDLKNHMRNIFLEYDIFSYVENLNNILNEENVVFFINHNMGNSKLNIVILFCFIFEVRDFITKILNCLLNCEEGIQLEENLNFILFFEYLSEFIRDFFKDFKSIDTNRLLQDLFKDSFKENCLLGNLLAN
jgi:hypothetical protein